MHRKNAENYFTWKSDLKYFNTTCVSVFTLCIEFWILFYTTTLYRMQIFKWRSATHYEGRIRCTIKQPSFTTLFQHCPRSSAERYEDHAAKDNQSPSQFPTDESIITWSKRNKSAEDGCHHSQDKKYQQCIIFKNFQTTYFRMNIWKNFVNKKPPSLSAKWRILTKRSWQPDIW